MLSQYIISDVGYTKYNSNAGMKTYLDRIRELREDNDKTQREVARYLGTTQQVYSRYENGENEIPVRHIISLCRLYKVSADYMLGLSDKM